VSRRVLRQGESSYSCNEVFASMFASKVEAERSPERATGIDVWLRYVGCPPSLPPSLPSFLPRSSSE